MGSKKNLIWEYIVGIVLIGGSVKFFSSGDIISGLLCIVAASLVFSATYKKWCEKLHFLKSKKIRIFSIIGLFFIAYLAGVNTKNEQKQQQEAIRIAQEEERLAQIEKDRQDSIADPIAWETKKALAEAERRKKALDERKEKWMNDNLSSFHGFKPLWDYVKSQALIPKGLEYIGTTCYSNGDNGVIIVMEYTAKNAFGQDIPGKVRAKASWDGKLLEVGD